jgi:RNA polymerase sigma factor (sigma-70 family)
MVSSAFARHIGRGRYVRPKDRFAGFKGGRLAMIQVTHAEIAADLATTLQEAQRGDQTAWETIFKECYPKVRRVVRRRLTRSMRSLYDSTDFANEAMERLAANLNQLEFPSVNSLIAFLAQVAEQKVIDEYRRQHALKRDVTRGCSLSGMGPEGASVQFPSDEPTASQLAVANEVNEQLLERHDETERTIISLRRDGHSNADIAEQTGWHVRKVQRFLKDLLDSWSHSVGA